MRTETDSDHPGYVCRRQEIECMDFEAYVRTILGPDLEIKSRGRFKSEGFWSLKHACRQEQP